MDAILEQKHKLTGIVVSTYLTVCLFHYKSRTVCPIFGRHVTDLKDILHSTDFEIDRAYEVRVRPLFRVLHFTEHEPH